MGKVCAVISSLQTYINIFEYRLRTFKYIFILNMYVKGTVINIFVFVISTSIVEKHVIKTTLGQRITTSDFKFVAKLLVLSAEYRFEKLQF